MTGGWGLGIDFFEKIADIEALFLLCVEKSPEENFVQRKILPTGIWNLDRKKENPTR